MAIYQQTKTKSVVLGSTYWKNFTYQVWHDFKIHWEKVFPVYFCSQFGGSRRWTARKLFQLLSHSLTYCQGEKVNVPSPVGYTETCLLNFIADYHTPFLFLQHNGQQDQRSRIMWKGKRSYSFKKNKVRWIDEMDRETVWVCLHFLLWKIQVCVVFWVILYWSIHYTLRTRILGSESQTKCAVLPSISQTKPTPLQPQDLCEL